MGDSNKKANNPGPSPSLDKAGGVKPRQPLEVPRRKGGFTRAEKALLHAGYVAGETPEAVAARLGRPADTVKRHFDTLAARGVGLPADAPRPERTRRQQLLEDLHASPMWRAIRDKFETPEVRLYEEHWGKLIEQFGDDVVLTERMQVDRYLTGLLLADRNLVEQKRVRGELDEIRGLMRELKVQNAGGPPVGQDAARLVRMEDYEARYRDELTALVKEYRELEAGNNKLLEALKGTRNQRLERIEGRAVTMLDLVKDLMDEEKRETSGRQAALFREALLKKAAELAKPVKFADGGTDQPLLSPDTVGGDASG